jgi:YVTN family beta-propeller protein
LCSSSILVGVSSHPVDALAAPPAWTAYVTGPDSNTAAPINLANNALGTTIGVGTAPYSIAIAPGATTAYVANFGNNTITPVDVATNSPGTAFAAGASVSAIAITPDGTTAYVANFYSGTVTPINLATNANGTAIAVGTNPGAIAITPDGSTAYVANRTSNTVTPINLATNSPGTAIAVGAAPYAIAITPDGTTAYVANYTDNNVTPINVATNTPGTAIAVGVNPTAIAITSDGRTVYVANYGSSTVTPIVVATNIPESAIGVGTGPRGVAISPDGTTAYVASYSSSTVTPVIVATNTAQAAITVGFRPFAIAIAPDQAPVAALSVTVAAAGSPSSFDASASTVAFGTIASYAWSFGDGSNTTTTTPTTTHTYAAAGSYTASVTETDSAGTSTTRVFTGQTMSLNGGPGASTSRSLVVPLTTTTGIASSSNPSTAGGSVTYTATVAPAPDGGTVAFTDNGSPLTGCGAVAVSTSTGQASCTISYSAAGSHAIVGGYSGDTNFAVSSGSLTQQVNAAPIPMAVLPAVSNGAYGGYVTAATIQNTGTAAASVRIAYFDQNGAPVGGGDSVSSLPVNASWTVRQDNGNSFPSSGGDAVQAGSAIVYSNQPVAVFVNEFAPGNAGDATSYTGVPLPSGVGTTIYAPTIVNNAYGGYTTGIGLLNMGSTTTVTITYRDNSGTVVKTQTVSNIAPNAYKGVYSGNSGTPATDANLPDGFAGTATITNSGGQPVGAIVNEVGPGGQFSSYAAVTSGSALLNAPVALDNAFGGYFTGMAIQNTSGSAGSFTVTYYDSSGTPTVRTFSIAANGYMGVYQGSPTDGPPAAGAYTAVIQSSTVTLAAIVNEVVATTTAAKQATSYNTFSAGSAIIHLALVENAGSDPWNTGEGIMNTGAGTAVVDVNYFDAATGAAVGTMQTLTLAPHAFWGLFQPGGGLPAGTRATAVVTTVSGGTVAVICNESGPTTFMSYNGQ